MKTSEFEKNVKVHSKSNELGYNASAMTYEAEMATSAISRDDTRDIASHLGSTLFYLCKLALDIGVDLEFIMDLEIEKIKTESIKHGGVAKK